MEEDEYKSTYNEIAQNRCVFEKTLTNKQGQCRHARHFCLADREGYACASDETSANCRYLLEKLRENSRFFLKMHSVGSQLPHNVAIRVQVGGLRGLRSVLSADKSDLPIAGISDLIAQAVMKYDGLEQLPYGEIVQTVASYQGRSKNRRTSKKES